MSALVPTILQTLQARNLVSLTIGGGTIATDGSGTVTWGTPIEVSVATSGGTKEFESLTWSIDPDLLMDAPSDLPVASYIIDRDDFTVTLTLKELSSGPGTIMTVASTSDVIRLVAVYRPRGGSSGGTCVSIIGERGNASGMLGIGKNTASFTIRPFGNELFVGPVASNPY